MVIAGIDYSMTSPSICVYNGDLGKFNFNQCRFYFLTDRKKFSTSFLHNIKGEEFAFYSGDYMRFDTISDWAMKYLRGVDRVCIEGYAFGAKGKVFHIAENTGILKYKIFQAQIPLEVASPSTVKKLATGKGNATKDDMHSSFYRETGTDLIFALTPGKTECTSPVSDIVDSFYVCKYLCEAIKAEV